MGRVWPLLGRAEELRFIDAASRGARRSQAGVSQGVLLAGAPGVGKTRLAREALTAAERSGMASRWIAATASARSLPFGAFAGFLGDTRESSANVITRAIDALIAGVGRSAVVIGVDDAHFLDDHSALLVHQLVLRRVAVVVVTVRTGEPLPDAVAALWKDRHLDRLELQPLSAAETGALLEAVLLGPVESTSVRRAWELTCGNVLFLRHLVEDEEAAGRIRMARGLWRWWGEPVLSSGLAELVDARMGRLTEGVGAVVDALALHEPFGVNMLGALTGTAAVEQAESQGLVVVEHDGRRLQARLAHPLYGELRRARMGQLRSRRLRGEIADELAKIGGRRADDTLRRAVLAVDSDREPDPMLLTSAARAAIKLLDMGLAERLARAAVAAGGDEARLLLALALSWLGHGDDAETEFAAMTEYLHTDAEHIAILVPRVANLFWAARRPAAAEALLHGALDTVSDASDRCALAAIEAAMHGFLGRPQLALSAAEAALSSTTLSEQQELMAIYGLLCGLGLTGRADRLGPAAARGYAIAALSFDVAAPTFGLCDTHMLGLRLAGYLREAEEVARAHYERTASRPGAFGLLGHTLLGYAALYQGQLSTAILRMQESLAGMGTAGVQGFAFRTLLNLTVALAMIGDAGQARRSLTELVADNHPAFAYLEPEMVLARAWVAAAEGVTSEAREIAREAAEIAARRGQLAHEVLALQTALCFGDRRGADRLAQLCELVDGPRAPTVAAQAAALAEDDGVALHVASQRWEEMGDVFAAADAAAQAAAAHSRRGQRDLAKAAAVRAHRLADACGGVRTPALIEVARPLPLTNREREVVMLAAAGMSNQEIANRLVVSVRTVEGHLYRASAKLGVADRAQFAAILVDD